MVNNKFIIFKKELNHKLNRVALDSDEHSVMSKLLHDRRGWESLSKASFIQQAHSSKSEIKTMLNIYSIFIKIFAK